jgi:hypothetical protein
MRVLMKLLQGRVKIPTGGTAREPLPCGEADPGVIPEPTVTVWMEEGTKNHI